MCVFFFFNSHTSLSLYLPALLGKLAARFDCQWRAPDPYPVARRAYAQSYLQHETHVQKCTASARCSRVHCVLTAVFIIVWPRVHVPYAIGYYH